MENKELKKLLYFLPNFILLLLNGVALPIQRLYLNYKVERATEFSVTDSPMLIDHHDFVDDALKIWIVAIIGIVVMRIMLSAKKCNISNWGLKILNNLLTIIFSFTLIFISMVFV